MTKTIKTSTTPFDLSTEIYTALGEVTVAWSGVESMVGTGISKLLKIEFESAIPVLSNMNISPQLDSALTLCQMVLAPDKQGKVMEVLKRTRTMNTERNKMVHGRWFQTEKANTALRIVGRAYGEPTEERHLHTAKSIHNFAKQIRELSVDLVDAYIEAGLVRSDERPMADAVIIEL